MAEPFNKLPPISPTKSDNLTSPRQATYATERARLLLGCYRKGDAADPDTYAAAVAAVLSEYPADVIRRATDPRTGIASAVQWLPTIAEVKSFCENEFAPVRRQAMRDELEEQRKRALPPPIEDKSNRPTYDELKAKHGEHWGIDTEYLHDYEKRRAVTIAEIERANQIAFERECKAAGIKSDSPVSPSLAKIIANPTRIPS